MVRRERLYQPRIEEKAVHLLESSLKIGGSIDLKLAMSWAYLSDIYIAQTNWAEESLSLARDLGRIGELDVSLALSISGIICLKCRKLDRAEENLTQSLAEAPELVDAHREIALVSLATLYEALKAFDKAEHFYQLAHMEAHRLGRNYFECGALTGMIRVRYAQNNSTAIPPLWTEARRLAQQYEYNDYFTSLFLTRGHLTWDGLIPEWESGFDSALRHYQYTLIYALRCNRFLLDEALAGRKQGTTLHSIILHCLEHGEEGQHMLIALRDWWQSGINDIGTSRPDTISPFPESIPLLEAESIARQREPGDSSPQKDVGEQINAALIMAKGGERLSP